MAVSHLKARERLAMSVFFYFPDGPSSFSVVICLAPFKHYVRYRKEPRYVD